MADVIDALKQGNYNENAGAKMMFEKQNSQVRHELKTAQNELEQLRKGTEAINLSAWREGIPVSNIVKNGQTDTYQLELTHFVMTFSRL